MSGASVAITIRPEAAGDEATIFDLTKAAFRDMPFSEGDEQHLINALRKDGDLTLSLVAQDETRIVGHIAFSPIQIEDGTQGWFDLGPVSVWPHLHHRGIGSALIQRGISDLRTLGAKGIVLVGSPEYYSRFGFRHQPQPTYPGPLADYFQCLLLDGDWPSGAVTHAPAFR